MTALLEPDVLARDSIRDAIGDSTDTVGSFDELAVLMRTQPELDTVILGPSVDNELALEFADRLRATSPTVGVILVRRRIDAAILTQAIRSGVREVVTERDLNALTEAVQRSLKWGARRPVRYTNRNGCRPAPSLTVPWAGAPVWVASSSIT